MIKKFLWVLVFFLLATPCFAFTGAPKDDANCQGAWLMEDVGNESDQSAGGTETLTETGGTIARDADRQFGDWSRAFVASETEWLEAADGGTTDISGVNQAISIVFWMKSAEASIGVNNYIVSKYLTTTDRRQYAVRIDNGEGEALVFALSSDGSSGGLSNCIGATKVTTQAWVHVACVYDDTDQRIYINGALDSNGASNPLTYSGGIANKTAEFRVGGRHGAGLIPFDGKLDDVAVFDRALTEAEVNQIMNTGLSVSAAVGAGQVILIMN